PSACTLTWPVSPRSASRPRVLPHGRSETRPRASSATYRRLHSRLTMNATAATTISATTTPTTVGLPSAYPHHPTPRPCIPLEAGQEVEWIQCGRHCYNRTSVSYSFPLDGARVRFSGDTNIGRKRDHNEDSIALPETGERLAIVCDGMGGHASGE